MLTRSWVNLISRLFSRRRLARPHQHISRDDQFAMLLDELDLGVLAVGIDIENAGLSRRLMWHSNTLVLVLWANARAHKLRSNHALHEHSAFRRESPRFLCEDINL